MLEHLLGVQVSEETARRLTEQAGARIEAAQTAQANAPVQEDPHAKAGPARLVMSADGACVPLLHGEWAEVRTVAIGEVEERCTADGEQEIHVGQLSYFSRLTDAETFADLAEVEMRRRKVVQAELVEPFSPPCQPAPTQKVPPRVPPAPAATLPGSCRPSAYHPWKRGRACAPKVVAKI